MKHLGDISKVDGGTIAPVDIITFGSPCTDLSVAGKQAGLEGNRSGGFPLAGLLDGITTLWASEVEPYPIAVTEWNFSGRAQLLLGGTTDE